MGNLYFASFWQIEPENFYDPAFPGTIAGKAFQYLGWVHELTADGIQSMSYQFEYIQNPYPYPPGFSNWVGGLVNNTGGPTISSQFSKLSLRINSSVELISSPYDLAIDHAGNVFETADNALRKTTVAGVATTLAGFPLAEASTSTDGTGAAARFTNPVALALDTTGNLFVSDFTANCVRKVTPTGIVTTLAGLPGNPGDVDGTGIRARFNGPRGIAVDRVGNVYVADSYNSTIRKISPLGETTTLAGSSKEGGTEDGLGSLARFLWPEGLTIDPSGNLFVADTINCTIRKITPSGEVTTFAGAANKMGTADGTGSAARFSNPSGLTADAAGNLFVIEEMSAPYSVARIRKINQAAEVTTIAGGPESFVDGSGTVARFNVPSGIAVDASGNLFVTDSSTVRMVTPDGVVSTLAGLVDVAGETDGAGPEVRFYHPAGIAATTTGMLYVTSGTTIRQGQPATTPVIAVQPASQNIAAGATAQFSVSAAAIPTPTYQWYFNGSAFSGATSNTLSFINARSTDAGDYTVVVTNSLGSVTSSKATLTVSPASSPTPGSGAGSSSGGGSIGGNFFLALALLCTRRLHAALSRRERDRF